MNWYETSNALVPSQNDLGWLISRGGGDIPYFTGSDASGWEDSVWILNSFYELPVEGALPTYGEIHKSRIASGGEEPLILNGGNLGEITPGTSMGLGYERRPSADWRRRTWSDMLVRFPLPRPADGPPPCHSWFLGHEFPVNIELPTEGSLGEEDFTELINVLTHHSPAPTCSIYFANVFSSVDDPHKAPVYDAHLMDLPALLKEAAEDHQVFTPANIWPPDRSWLVYTDYDLWATKVSGSTALINEFRSNPLLETLDWAPAQATNQAT